MAKAAKEKPQGLEAILAKLNKDFGKGSVMSLNDKISGTYELIPTGSIKYDNIVLGIGGFAKGKIYEIRGWEGCLAEDTYIKFIQVRPDGVVQDCKGQTIKNLFERFHNRNEKTKDSSFYVMGIN